MTAEHSPGPLNLITDVPGLTAGNAEDGLLKSGVTVVVPDEPAVASVAIQGGAPGSRETALLEPDQTVSHVDALVLAGGSAFGLDAAAGVQAQLAALGRGFAVGPARVPIVPGAILFDLLNGGDKDWGDTQPYRRLGQQALDNAGRVFQLGSAGAGMGATTANVKGGLGSASQRLPDGTTVGALVAVNALGQPTIADTAHFWAAPFEQGDEFGGLGLPHPLPPNAMRVETKLDARNAGVSPQATAGPGANTTIAVIATDAALTKAEAKRLAVMAHDGMARALWPAHTPLDGDLIFALSTGRQPLADPIAGMLHLGAAAASCLARAIARGVYHASAAEGDTVPAWRDRFA